MKAPFMVGMVRVEVVAFVTSNPVKARLPFYRVTIPIQIFQVESEPNKERRHPHSYSNLYVWDRILLFRLITSSHIHSSFYNLNGGCHSFNLNDKPLWDTLGQET